MTAVKDTIAARNDFFMKTFGAGDAAGVAALYTAEGELLPPGADAVVGQEAIEGFWTMVMGMGIASARLETVELDDQGDTAIEIGRYTLSTAGGEVADEGKYLVVWKNRDGEWKLHRDIWNTSRS